MRVRFHSLLVIGAVAFLICASSSEARRRPKDKNPKPADDTKSSVKELYPNLWKADTNACVLGKDVIVNLQGKKYSEKNLDEAGRPLFTYVNEKVLSKPTYKLFIDLLDNYVTRVDVCEVYTDQEKQEISNFLDAVLDTKVMKLAQEFLVRKGLVENGREAFRQKLYDVWFQPYKRKANGRCADSCGFEHVFIGESRAPKVIGFHNWIQFYLQEKRGALNFHGYYEADLEGGTNRPPLLTTQFTWGSHGVKVKSSMFLCTSPEFEMSVYTVAFLITQPNKGGTVTLDSESGAKVQCFTTQDNLAMGTCYASLPK